MTQSVPGASAYMQSKYGYHSIEENKSEVLQKIYIRNFYMYVIFISSPVQEQIASHPPPCTGCYKCLHYAWPLFPPTPSLK
jgi:hypothetical protein